MINAINNVSLNNKVAFGSKHDKDQRTKYSTTEKFGQDYFVSTRAAGSKQPSKKGAVGRMFDSFVDSFAQQRVKSYERKKQDMFAIQDTIEEFKQWRPYLTNATADFVNDFYKSAQGLTSMEDYTSHNNKYYSDHNAPETYPLYVNNREFNVHLDRREKQSKYADYPIMINVPVGVTHDEVFDRRGNLVSARGLIDFANKTALLDFQAHNNGYTASTMHVIDKPKKGKSDFLGTIPSRIGYPMTLKDVDYRTDGIVTASEMVVYKTDEDNKLVSTRTYLNPVIKPLVAKKGNGVRPGDFVINSRMTLDADYYKGNVKSTRFYMGHKEYHEGNFVDEAAERMLEVKRHGMAKAYLDFAEDIDGSSCRVVQDCNL